MKKPPLWALCLGFAKDSAPEQGIILFLEIKFKITSWRLFARRMA